MKTPNTIKDAEFYSKGICTLCSDNCDPVSTCVYNETHEDPELTVRVKDCRESVDAYLTTNVDKE